MTSSSYTVHFVTVDIIDSNILVLKLYIIIIQIEEFMEQFMEYGSYMYYYFPNTVFSFAAINLKN